MRTLSNLFYQRRTLTLLLMLTPPLLWFGVVYLGSLLTLLSQSVFVFDDMSIRPTWTSCCARWAWPSP